MYSIIYFWVLVFLDSFLYGYCFEIKQKMYNINKGIFNNWFFDFLYKLVPMKLLFPLKVSIDKDQVFSETPYRIFQKILEIGGAILVWYLYDWNWLPMAGIVLAYYLMSFEWGYYVLMNQFSLLQTSHKHLQRWYQVGRFLSSNEHYFDTWSFIFLSICGLLLLILTGVLH